MTISVEQIEQHLQGRTVDMRVELDYPGAGILLLADSQIDLMMRSRSCAKEPETVAFLERYAKAGERLYDVGANVGAYSLIAAHLGAEVVAFEPAARNYVQLVRNTKLNRMPRIMPIAAALSDHNGTGWLALDADLSGASAHMASPLDGHYDERVVQWRLDDLVRMLGLSAPTFLKVDVDGGEVAVLAGAKLTLEGVRGALIETEAANVETCAYFMRESGFELVGTHPRIAAGVQNIEWARA
jgi:FkbM family methyltransferase